MYANILTWTHGMTNEEWRNWRRKGIGGSDAAAVCCADPWKSPIEVYLEKINQSPETETNEAMQLGLRLKNFISRQFSEKTGFRVRRRNAILQHPKHPFMIANIDRWIDRQNAGLLCKNSGEFMKDKWKNPVPEKFELQCQHYMAVTGADFWWLAVLIGGNKFKMIKIERNEKTVTDLIRTEQDFWENNVVKRQIPTFDGSKASSEFLKRTYPKVKRMNPVQLPLEARWWIEQYFETGSKEKQLTSRKKEAENRLKALLGKHEAGYIEDYRVEWKMISPKNKKSYRKFRIEKTGEGKL